MGAVLCLCWMVLLVVILGFMFFGVGFGLLRKVFWLIRPLEIPRLYSLLGLVAGGCLGHGPIHLLIKSAGIIRFCLGSCECLVGIGLVYLSCIIWLGLINISNLPFGTLGGSRSALICAEGKDSGEGPMLDIACSFQLLHAPRVRERDKPLLRSIMVGGVWDGFLLGHAKARNRSMPLLWRVSMETGTSFGNVLTSPLVQIRENPEFHHLIQRDKRTWPGCLLWHGWLPALNCSGGLGWKTSYPCCQRILESRLGGYVCEDFNGWCYHGGLGCVGEAWGS